MAAYLGPLFAGVVSMAVLAAIMDAGGLLLIATTTVTRDLYVPLFPNSTDKQQLAVSRIAAIVLGLIGTWFGLRAESILGQILSAFQIRSVAGIVLFVAILWKRVSNDAAFWSMLCGGITATIWVVFGNPFNIQPLWPAMLITFIILIPMSIMNRETGHAYLRAKEMIALVNDQESKRKEKL